MLEGVSSFQTSLLLMKSLNKTETPIFRSVLCSLFPKAIFYDVYFTTLQLMSVRVPAVECLPVLPHSADYISFPLGPLSPLWYI